MTTMTTKEWLVNKALADVDSVQEKMRHHREAGRFDLANSFGWELKRAWSAHAFVENLSDSDAEIAVRLFS